MLNKRNVLLLVTCMCLLIVTGCGFKSDPSPASKDDSFNWSSLTVTAVSPCISVEGDINGKVASVDEIIFEVQKAGEEADCPTCPFSADEEFVFEPSELGLLSNSGKFEARFCPTQISTLYRVKATAKSKFLGMPDAVSKEHFVEMP
ncbi:MAG: hypothetical protein MI749_09175 [Desulfovibrionales bacterium]|nr:hypothetical protein [Desulfovibrionales bacterium]